MKVCEVGEKQPMEGTTEMRQRRFLSAKFLVPVAVILWLVACRPHINLRAQQGGSGGFTADSGCDSSTAAWRVLQVGLTKHFWINILLTLLGYIPGIVHAVWVIAKY